MVASFFKGKFLHNHRGAKALNANKIDGVFTSFSFSNLNFIARAVIDFLLLLECSRKFFWLRINASNAICYQLLSKTTCIVIFHSSDDEFHAN